MIISPWFFYAIQVCDGIAFVFCMLGFLSLSAAVVVSICILVDIAYDNWDIEEKALNFVKKLVIAGVISIIIAVFIPSKETLIEMQIAKLATKENIDSAVTYVIDTVKEFTAEEDK